MTEPGSWRLVAVGCAAGVMAGLFGIGGGVVMIPPLVAWVGLTQHEAHATSLAAIIPIAAAGAVTFGMDGQLDAAAAALFVVGSIAGAPLGARVMARSSEAALKIAFGVLAVTVGSLLVWT